MDSAQALSSPQWFSLYLANNYPGVNFHYINIIDRELDPFKEIVKALGINNLRYSREDVRAMRFGESTFDKVISISAIEHVYPEEGGDLKALNDICRVLKSKGELLLTVPYKSKSNIVYSDGAVYERKVQKGNFFAREYDEAMFNKLIAASSFSLTGSWFICEGSGFFAVDYYEWGPGQNDLAAKVLINSRQLLERVTEKFGKSLDELLAKQYLSVSREISGRLVNISARLTKA